MEGMGWAEMVWGGEKRLGGEWGEGAGMPKPQSPRRKSAILTLPHPLLWDAQEPTRHVGIVPQGMGHRACATGHLPQGMCHRAPATEHVPHGMCHRGTTWGITGMALWGCATGHVPQGVCHRACATGGVPQGMCHRGVCHRGCAKGGCATGDVPQGNLHFPKSQKSAALWAADFWHKFF